MRDGSISPVALIDEPVLVVGIVIGIMERAVGVGADVPVGDEPVVEVVDQEERDVLDGIVVGIDVGAGAFTCGDQGRNIRCQHETGRFPTSCVSFWATGSVF